MYILYNRGNICWYLRHLQHIMDINTCYYEAYRRLIINIFTIVITSLLNGNLSTEYNITGLSERVGSGPLDYFLESTGLFEVVNTVATEAARAGQDVEETDLDDTVEIEEKWKHFIDAVLSDTELEAKSDLELQKCLGQLFAQLLDVLQRGRKRKRDSGTAVTATVVKGILSTGQQTLFFLMQQGPTDRLPVVSYLGRRAVDVLTKRPKSNNGESVVRVAGAGSHAAFPSGTDSKLEDQVSALLTAMYAFATLK